MRTAIMLVLALLALAGCARDLATTSGSAASAPPLPPKPEWAVQILRAADCLGKTKAEVVETLGGPKITNALFGGDASVYRYQIGDDPVEGGLFGSGENTVQYLEVKFDHDKKVERIRRVFKRDEREDVEDVWQALDITGNKPSSVLSSEEAIKRFWLNENRFRVSTSPYTIPPGPRVVEFPVTFKGRLNGGQVVLVSANAPTPPMKGERRFNPENDRSEIGDLLPNADFDWRACSVYGVTIVSEGAGGDMGKEFPLHP